MIAFLLKKLVIFYKFFKIDTPLLILLILLSSFGLLILYSSSGGSLSPVYRQMVHLAPCHLCNACHCSNSAYHHAKVCSHINAFGCFPVNTCSIFWKLRRWGTALARPWICSVSTVGANEDYCSNDYCSDTE